MSKMIKAYDGSIISNINSIGAAVSDVIGYIRANYGPFGGVYPVRIDRGFE